MPEPRDTCRPVTLPSGETLRVRGDEPMSPEAVAALGEVVTAARAKMAAEHPPNPAAEALWTLVEAARTPGSTLRDLAREIGVTFKTMARLWQGYLPDDGDLVLIERWLRQTQDDTTKSGGSS